MGDFKSITHSIFRDPRVDSEVQAPAPINFGNPFRKLTSKDVVNFDDPDISLPKSE